MDSFFLRIRQACLADYDGIEGIAREWQSLDGALGKAPLTTECFGKNPTDRGESAKMGGGKNHSWPQRWRKLLVNSEKAEASCCDLPCLAAGLICWRQSLSIFG
jgi:hypothetical protein